MKKLGLKIWGYSLGEYLYVLARNGLTLRHKTYSITQEDNNKQSVKREIWYIAGRRKR